MHTSSTYVGLSYTVSYTARYDLCSTESSMIVYVYYLAHPGAAYAVIVSHMASIVVLIVIAFLPHFELYNLFRRCILIFSMFCL